LGHCPPPAFAHALSAPLLLPLQASTLSSWPRSAGEVRACSSQLCLSFDPGEGIRSGRPMDFPGAWRLTMHCAPVMFTLVQDPAGLPTVSFRDGCRRPRTRKRGNGAYEHPEGDPNVVFARALPLGGRAADLWFYLRFHQSAPMTAGTRRADKPCVVRCASSEPRGCSLAHQR